MLLDAPCTGQVAERKGRTRIWMQLAYRNVPPEKSTHSAMPAGEDSAGAAASSANVATAAIGDAAAKSASARRVRGRVHRAAARYVANPNATGACAHSTQDTHLGV